MAAKLLRNMGIKTEKVYIEPFTCTAGVTPEIDLGGGTLTGILLESDITSTTFTITVSRTSGGTFATVKDPLSSGADITYTLAATATGYYPINPITTQGFRYCKINLNQSETPTIYVSRKNIE
jgi:hypothetical protein